MVNYNLLEKRYTCVALKFFKRMKKKHNVICLLVTGSYFKKRLTKKSDLDIFLIADKSCSLREKGVMIIDGIKVSYFLNPYWKILELLNSEKAKLKRPTAEFVYFSDCLIGKEEGHNLKKIAKETIDSSTPKIASKEVLYLGWKLYDKLGVFKRKNYERFNKEYLKFDLFDFSINTFFLIKRLYKPNAKYVLKRIKIIDNLFYNKVKKFLEDKSDSNLINLTRYLLRLLNFKSENYFRRIKAKD